MGLKTTADRIAAYIRLRDAKEDAEKAFKKSMERINLAIQTLEGELLNDLNQAGTDSVAVKGVGTAFRKMRDSASVDDRDAFLEHIRSTGDWEGMDVRASKDYVRDYMANRGEPVPGVKYTSDTTVSVRRSS